MHEKNKKTVIFGFAAIFFILIVFILFFLKINEDELFVKRCYHENRDRLDDLVYYFEDLYEPALQNITYDTQRNAIEKIYSDRNERIPCEDEYVHSRIMELHDRYAANSDYDVFYNIRVDYDAAGNILMSLVARNVKLRERDGEERSQLCFLIYADEKYNGSGFLSFDRSKQKPFSGNWYYWSHSGPIG